MIQEVVNLGGEDYSIEYSVCGDKININSVFNLFGYFVDISIELESEIIEKLGYNGSY